RVFSSDGSLRTVIRVLAPARKVTDEVWSQIVEDALPIDLTGTERAAQRATLLSGPRPTHFPAYGRVISGPGGHLWVQDYSDQAPSRWTVFAPDGESIARVE